MSWSIGYDSYWKRDIGYGVPAWCDHPGCEEEIDRGLSYVCGGEPYGGKHGCGLYFCSKHLSMSARRPQRCVRCCRNRNPFTPTPDHPEWVQHKATDPSWAEWRETISTQLQASKTGVLDRATPTVGLSQGLPKHLPEQGGADDVNQQQDNQNRSSVTPRPHRSPSGTGGSGGESPRSQAKSTIA